MQIMNIMGDKKYWFILLAIVSLGRLVLMFADKTQREKYKYQFQGKRNIIIIIIIALLSLLLFYIVTHS